MKGKQKESVSVNNTRHYPITFPSKIHLLDFAEPDEDIKHPLGVVYKTKIAHNDNMVRIVVLNNEGRPDGRIEAFMFDKEQWGHADNPFTPEYNDAERVAMRKIIETGAKIRKYFKKIIKR